MSETTDALLVKAHELLSGDPAIQADELRLIIEHAIDELASLRQQLHAAEQQVHQPPVGWVSHATMVSQINAGIAAARAEVWEEAAKMADACAVVRHCGVAAALRQRKGE